MSKDLKIPNHIAIIMDGNGRWARRRMLPKSLGHRQGMLAAEKIINKCKLLGVRYLTLYAFSLENWSRDRSEVDDLMNILSDYLENRVKELLNDNVRVMFIGNKDLLPINIQNKMREIEDLSKLNEFNLILAISYSGRDEIECAAYNLANSALKDPDILNLKRGVFKDFINPLEIPDPDLLIRTGGEKRLSNFLLWQIAYSELYFVDKFWPDFYAQDLLIAIEDFSKRDRRYGK
jgi:undecaprenyl diphosphate synthase